LAAQAPPAYANWLVNLLSHTVIQSLSFIVFCVCFALLMASVSPPSHPLTPFLPPSLHLPTTHTHTLTQVKNLIGQSVNVKLFGQYEDMKTLKDPLSTALNFLKTQQNPKKPKKDIKPTKTPTKITKTQPLWGGFEYKPYYYNEVCTNISIKPTIYIIKYLLNPPSI
jgi:hypothetical protein